MSDMCTDNPTVGFSSFNDKKDYSNKCNMNDDDINNPCWKCIHFYFPIGCMKGEKQ